jgi:hypothetical protein
MRNQATAPAMLPSPPSENSFAGPLLGGSPIELLCDDKMNKKIWDKKDMMSHQCAELNILSEIEESKMIASIALACFAVGASAAPSADLVTDLPGWYTDLPSK